MLILLPPSEGKAPAGSGRPVNLDALSLPSLNPTRERVLDALISLCRQPDQEQARLALGLAEGQRAEIARNAGLREARTLPAERLYTGVLYEALGLTTLAEAHRRAKRSILIFSALWGAVRIGDRLPPYRCSSNARLPGMGGLATAWRPALAAAVAEEAGGGVVLDLRSTGYAAMWAPSGDLARRTRAVRVLHERVVNGVPTRSVVSHFNKATKGRLVRDLLLAGAFPRTPAALVAALRDLKYTVEEPGDGRLDIVVEEI